MIDPYTINPWMCSNEPYQGGWKGSPPFRFVQARTAPIWTANPRQHAKSVQPIEKSLHLRWVNHRQLSVWLRWAQMRKHISDVVAAQSVCRFTDSSRITKAGNFDCLPISNEPLVPTKPPVRKPDSIPTSIVPAV